MKKPLFFVLYFMIPAIPIYFYRTSIGGGFDSYGASVALGISAFVFMCGQFILASRPVWVVKALGLKNLLSFHGTMPPVIIALAAAHKLLKEYNGFPDDTLQASLGAVSWWIIAAAIVFAVVLMANTFWLRIPALKKLKTLVYEKFRLGYKTVRMMHNITVLAGILLMVHVFLASSSDFRFNPAGIIFMGSWLFISLFLYLRYKIIGMSSKERN